MKNKYLIIALLLLAFIKGLNAQIIQNRTIDIYDTVVFDVSQAAVVTVGVDNYVDIPISFKSDDIINALDFSLKYNHSNLLYDTIFDFTGHIQMAEYYNPNDSTIRFTSNSLTVYTNLVKTVSIRFKMLSNQMSNTDLNTLLAYLNGDLSSVKLVGAVIGIGINELEVSNLFNSYPNPATESICISVNQISDMDIIDLSGKIVYKQNDLSPISENKIDVNFLSAGMYILKVTSISTDAVQLKKIIINK